MEEKKFKFVAIIAKTRGGNELLDIKNEFVKSEQESDELWDSLIFVQEHVFEDSLIEGSDGIYRCYLTGSIKDSEDELKFKVRNYEVRATALLIAFVGLY